MFENLVGPELARIEFSKNRQEVPRENCHQFLYIHFPFLSFA